MRNTPILCFLIFISVTLSAQENGTPGYIVRSTGDTIRGYLKPQPVDSRIDGIPFSTGAGYTIYSPAEVSAYQYEGGNAYRAMTFTNQLGQQESRFARLLVSGQCELYSFFETGVLYFLIRKDTIVHLLYDDDLHAEPYVKGNFRNELNFFAVGCEPARHNLESLSYSEENLMRYFLKLDACLDPRAGATTYFHKAKARFGFFAYAGGFAYSDSRSQFTGEARLQLTYPQFKPAISFNLGVRYITMVKQVQDLRFAAKYLHKTTYNITSFPLTVQYNLTHGIVQPYLFTGLSLLQLHASADIPLTYMGYYYNDSWGPAFLVGAGVEIRLTDFLRARLEWRYESEVQYPTLGLALKF
jgi:opacity protein-like surface antigen